MIEKVIAIANSPKTSPPNIYSPTIANNVEILVINDGSKDDGATEEIAKSYGDKIRYFSKENGGVSSALNRGIKEMKGEYFSWLSHDDLYLPQKIEHQIDILKTMAESAQQTVLVGDAELIDENRKKIFRPSKRPLGTYTGLEIFVKLQHDFWGLNGCAMLIPKNILNNVGFFDENLRYIQDYEYWYRIMIEGFSFMLTEEKNVLNRVHSGQVTARFPDLFYTEIEVVAKRMFERFFETENYDYLEPYLCGCAKDLNPVTRQTIPRLKEIKRYPFGLRIKVFRAYSFGFTKKILKKVYHSILLKGKR